MSANQPERDADSPEREVIEAALDIELARGPAHRGDVMRATNALCRRVGVDLTRWLGREGWAALLGRAVAEARPSALRLSASLELRWTDDANRALARAGCVEMLVGLIGLLARFVGADMALRLVEQSFAAGDDQSGGSEDE